MFRPKPGYRLELHILKCHAAQNLNRDFMNHPKSMYIGGCRRLRLSSQAEKYSIRQSDIFHQFLEEAAEQYGATRMVRTRKSINYIEHMLEEKIIHHGKNPVEYKDQIHAATRSLSNLFTKQDTTKDIGETTTQLIAFSQSEIQFIIDQILEINASNEIIIKDIFETIKQLGKDRESFGSLSPELQLFGRFTTSSTYYQNIVSPLQVAHAFSVHEARIEQDYWSAVDDLNKPSENMGSAHLDSRSFGAGVFYQYYCLDIPTLTKNIAAAFVALNNEDKLNLTSDLIAAFLYAVLTRNLVGNQASFANNDIPFLIYTTYGNAFPYSAQEAFECPVLMGPKGGYSDNAKCCFINWMDKRKKRFGLFCGYENHIGINDSDVDLITLVESTVEQTIPAIRSNLC